MLKCTKEVKMKKVLICIAVLFLLCACQKKVTKTLVEGNFKDYYALSDGTYECEGHNYKYLLEISGRMASAAKDTTFVYLSNIKDISFDRAWKAAGLSSNLNDYFKIDEAVLVEMR